MKLIAAVLAGLSLLAVPAFGQDDPIEQVPRSKLVAMLSQHEADLATIAKREEQIEDLAKKLDRVADLASLCLANFHGPK